MLASLRAKAIKGHVANPFPFIDVEDFLPAWAVEVGSGSDAANTAEETDFAGASRKKRLDVIRWTSAFLNMALAADAVGTWKYPSAMAHLRTCLQIAGTAGTEHRRGVLAQLYDEICRNEWAERALRGDTDFDVNSASLRLSNDLLERARTAHDGAGTAGGAGSKQQKPAKKPNTEKIWTQPSKGKGKGKGRQQHVKASWGKDKYASNNNYYKKW